jgi:hypothetical protein
MKLILLGFQSQIIPGGGIYLNAYFRMLPDNLFITISYCLN